MAYAIRECVRNELTKKLEAQIRLQVRNRAPWFQSHTWQEFYERVNLFIDTTVVSFALEEAYATQPRYLLEAYHYWCREILKVA